MAGGALKVEADGGRAVAAVSVPLAGAGAGGGAEWVRAHCPWLEVWREPGRGGAGETAVVVGRGGSGAAGAGARSRNSATEVDYVADSRVEACAGPPATRLAVAVVNRARGTFTMVPCVGDGQLLRLQARVRGRREAADATGGADSGGAGGGAVDAEEARALAYKRRRDTTMSYGSLRSKRLLLQAEKHRIDPNRVVQRQALGATIGKAVKEQAQEQADAAGLAALAQQDRLENLPPHDLTATRPEAAYPIRRMVGPGAMQALKEQTSLFLRVLDPQCDVRETLSGQLLALGAPPQLVELAQEAGAARGGAALAADGRTNRAEALALLSVLLPLMEAFNKGKGRLSGESVEKIAEVLKVPAIPLEVMLGKFSDRRNGKAKVFFSRSPDQGLLMKNCVLVLTLAVHNYNLNLDDATLLLKGRKVSGPQLRALGCTGAGGRFRLLAPKAVKTELPDSGEESAPSAAPTLADCLPKIKTQRAPARGRRN